VFYCSFLKEKCKKLKNNHHNIRKIKEGHLTINHNIKKHNPNNTIPQIQHQKTISIEIHQKKLKLKIKPINNMSLKLMGGDHQTNIAK